MVTGGLVRLPLWPMPKRPLARGTASLVRVGRHRPTLTNVSSANELPEEDNTAGESDACGENRCREGLMARPGQ